MSAVHGVVEALGKLPRIQGGQNPLNCLAHAPQSPIGRGSAGCENGLSVWLSGLACPRRGFQVALVTG